MGHASYVWTVQEKNDGYDTSDLAYVGWNRCFQSLDDAKDAIRESAMDICDGETPTESWVEQEDGRHLGVFDGDPAFAYAVVRAAIG